MFKVSFKPSFLLKAFGFIAISIFIHYISSKIDLFEKFYRFIRRNEKYEFDEIVILAFAWIIYLLVLLIINRRTIRNQNKELKKLNALLNENLKQKNQLFSIIGHDLKNPFNAIIGFSDFILSRYNHIDEKKLLSMLAMINSASKRTYELLNNLLHWGRIENSNTQIQQSKIDLLDIIKDEVAFFDIISQSKNVKVDVQVINDISIWGDYQMIKTIIRNIISNAIKFSYKDGKVKISAEKEGNNVNVRISDSGKGMSPDQLKTLFIEQGETTSGTNNEEGTGLGLYLCYRLIEKNNGKIQVNSKLDQGSEFILTFPSNAR